jgi:hypothetical protein
MLRKIIYLILILSMNIFDIKAQDFAQKLFETYESYKEKSLGLRRTCQADILPIIEAIEKKSVFEVEKIGHSVENRPIYQLKIGTGPTKVLLWSQMHGNESTATRALFDIFHFFESEKDDFQDFKKEILTNCTLYFVPMLNPDGAEKYIRRNAFDIDLNRDALNLASPEAILLKKLQNDLKPDFGYNLHDQSPKYAVGNSDKQATMAFLATAYNEAREVNPIRKRSMQLIVGMNRILQNYIPNQVARFSDEFEPRAFGDNIQKWGTTLILIESGGYKGDIEKEFIRKLNFVSILSSLSSISKKAYETEKIEEYSQIPENNRALFDLLIKNVWMTISSKKIKVDIGINKEEKEANPWPKYTVKSNIEDIGDLSIFHGIDEIDAAGLELVSEKPIQLDQKADFTLVKDNKVVYKIKNGSIIK